MSQENDVEWTGVSSWSADDCDPSQGRVDLRRVLARLRHPEAAPEPVRVFTEPAAVWCPLRATGV
jgi:hypothetical protein